MSSRRNRPVRLRLRLTFLLRKINYILHADKIKFALQQVLRLLYYLYILPSLDIVYQDMMV